MLVLVLVYLELIHEIFAVELLQFYGICLLLRPPVSLIFYIMYKYARIIAIYCMLCNHPLYSHPDCIKVVTALPQIEIILVVMTTISQSDVVVTTV